MKLAVGTPWSSPFMYTEYVDSAMNLSVPEGCQIRYFRGRGFCPARAHNHLCEQAVGWGAEVLVIIGPDQVHPPDMLEKLIAHWRAGRLLVAAMVPFRGYIPDQGMRAPFQPMAWRIVDEKPVPIVPEDGSLQKADIVGTGVLMFPAWGLQRVKRPWFHERIVDAESFARTPDQDSRFICRLAKRCELQLYVDLTIKVKHLNVFGIDESFQHRFADWEVGGDPDIIRKENLGLKKVRREGNRV